MRGVTHAAVAGGVLAAAGFSWEQAGVAALFALLPDVDHPASYAGRGARVVGAAALVSGIATRDPGTAILGLVATVVPFMIRHRGPTHTLWALLVTGALVWASRPALLVPALWGYGSHLLLDSLTPSGIRPLGFGPELRLARVRTGSWLDGLAGIVGLLLAAWAFMGRPV